MALDLKPQEELLKGKVGPIASYNFKDIIEGTGTIVFFGFSSKEETTENFHLSSNAVYSDSIVQVINNDQSTFTEYFDLDFDTSIFNLPKRIKGTARVILTTGHFRSTGANQVYFIAKIRKWDGTDETEIASAQSGTYSVNSGTTNSKTMNIEIPISTVQHFKKGETLRVTIGLWAKSSNGTGTVGFAHDPKNRDDETGNNIIVDAHTTVMEVHIPFEIDP